MSANLRLVTPSELVETNGEPANNLHAEASVISACLVDPGAWARVADFLKPEHFFSEAHRRVVWAIAKLTEQKTAIDVVTVLNFLRDRGELEKAGGAGYVTETLLATPAPQNVRAHAIIVHGAWRKRSLRTACAAAVARLDVGTFDDFEDFASRVLAHVMRLVEDRPDRPIVTNIERVTNIANAALRAKNPEAAEQDTSQIRICTGFRQLDEHIGGLRPGQKFTVAALPKVGKTTFAIQALVNIAAGGIGCALYTPENTADDVAVLQLAMKARASVLRLQTSRVEGCQLHPDEVDRLIGVMSRGELNLPIHVDERTNLTIDDVCADVRRLVDTFPTLYGAPLGVVCIDFLQKLKPSRIDRRRERRDQVAYDTQQFTDLLKETRLIGIELAQQQSPERGKKNARPHYMAIAESTEPAKLAHLVMHLWRPDARDETFTKASLGAARTGTTRDFDWRLIGQHSRFEEL